MKIGIISDTHNDAPMIKKAIETFKSLAVEFIIHSGDLTSPKMLGYFKEMNCKFVLGNMDFSNKSKINNESTKLGFGSVETTCDITLGGKRFFIIHGNDVPTFRQAVASGDYDYIIKGHTHYYEDYVSNNTRIINPGALTGNREYRAVILDTDDDTVKRIKFDG